MKYLYNFELHLEAFFSIECKHSNYGLVMFKKITSAENLRSRASDDELNINSNRKMRKLFFNIT